MPNPPPPEHRPGGFTLVEVLVAVAILGVMAAMTYSGLQGALSARERLQEESTRLREVQRLFSLLERDLGQLAARDVLDEDGTIGAALVLAPGADWQVEFTRRGWENPTGAPRSTLQRVRWWLEDGTLHRGHWPVLDRAYPLTPTEEPVIAGVRRLELRFLDKKPPGEDAREWKAAWPPDASARDTLPVAIELDIDLADIGGITRVFLPAENTP